MVKYCQSFPIRSWVYLPPVYYTSYCLAFHFRDCQNCFCLLLTLSGFSSPKFLIPGIFHPKRWSPSSPCCPASERFPLNSSPLNLALTGKAEVCLHQNAPSSPPSTPSVLKALANIQRI